MATTLAQIPLPSPLTGPPEYGKAILPLFKFDKNYVNLNNGSFGSLPRVVSEYLMNLADRVEANPDKYHRVEFPPMLEAARARIAQLVKADVDECVFVPSTTAGINSILRNFNWTLGDVIIGFTTTYRGIERAMRYIADTHPGVNLSVIELTFPKSHQSILSDFEGHLRSVKAIHADATRTPRVVAVIDAIVSNPGVYMPWKDMVRICREQGVWSIVDAAHCIGQEVDIDLTAIQPDFWISNCHKWLFAKRGSAILYVPKRNQYIMKSALPTSWDYVSPSDPPGGPEVPNFVMQHEWPGATDFGPYLSVCATLDFRQWLGGEEKINAYCHALALQGGSRLAEILGTRLLDTTPNSELTMNMVNVELPLPSTPSRQEQDRINEVLEHQLLYDWNVSAMHFHHGNRWWVRCSAQIWNDLSDFEYLGKALQAICSGVQRTVKCSL